MIYLDQKICQSCGMPLSEKNIIATNKDGSLTQDYCIYCYKDGNFTEPDITMQEMADVCVHYMTNDEHGFDEKTARKIMTELLPKLNRWK